MKFLEYITGAILNEIIIYCIIVILLFGVAIFLY